MTKPNSVNLNNAHFDIGFASTALLPLHEIAMLYENDAFDVLTLTIRNAVTALRSINLRTSGLQEILLELDKKMEDYKKTGITQINRDFYGENHPAMDGFVRRQYVPVNDQLAYHQLFIENLAERNIVLNCASRLSKLKRKIAPDYQTAFNCGADLGEVCFLNKDEMERLLIAEPQKITSFLALMNMNADQLKDFVGVADRRQKMETIIKQVDLCHQIGPKDYVNPYLLLDQLEELYIDNEGNIFIKIGGGRYQLQKKKRKPTNAYSILFYMCENKKREISDKDIRDIDEKLGQWTIRDIRGLVTDLNTTIRNLHVNAGAVFYSKKKGVFAVKIKTDPRSYLK